MCIRDRFLESIYTFGLNDIEKEEVMKLAVSLTTQKAAELGVVALSLIHICLLWQNTAKTGCRIIPL